MGRDLAMIPQDEDHYLMRDRGGSANLIVRMATLATRSWHWKLERYLFRR